MEICGGSRAWKGVMVVVVVGPLGEGEAARVRTEESAVTTAGRAEIRRGVAGGASDQSCGFIAVREGGGGRMCWGAKLSEGIVT